MHCLRLVQSLFDGLHVSRQEVVERLWVAYLLTHHTCLPIMCLLTPLFSIFVHTLVHTHTSAVDHYDQAETFRKLFSAATFFCVCSSTAIRVRVGQELNDHECDDGGQRELWLQRGSANWHHTHKHTMKQTHKLAI